MRDKLKKTLSEIYLVLFFSLMIFSVSNFLADLIPFINTGVSVWLALAFSLLFIYLIDKIH